MKRLLVLLAAVSLLALNAACNINHAIKVDDSKFDPARIKTSDQSDSVSWENTGTTNHTATSNGNGAFFDTGEIVPGNTSSQIDFNFAGLFPYDDKDHPKAKGKIHIPLDVTTTASPGDLIFVTWAGSPGGGSTTIPAGFHADVQVRPPGAKHYHGAFTNKTGSDVSGSYKVTKNGIYRFRAHYVKDGVAKSLWTPPAVCNVTS